MDTSWKVERLRRNVHVIAFDNVEHGWKQSILLTGDRHHDNKHTLQHIEKKHLDEAKELNAPIIDVGDLFCAMQGRYDSRRSQDSLRPEHRGDDYFTLLLDEAEDFYAPYADQFAVLGKGNHETSILKHNSLDLTKMLTTRLSRHTTREDRCFMSGYAGYIVLRFSVHKTVGRHIIIKHFHGHGGGGPVTKGVIQTNRRAVYMPDADIIVTGHIHEAWVVPIMRERFSHRSGKTQITPQWHVSVPTYKEEFGDHYDGYHVEGGRPPKPIGCVWLDMEFATPSAIEYSFRLEI